VRLRRKMNKYQIEISKVPSQQCSIAKRNSSLDKGIYKALARRVLENKKCKNNNAY